MAWGGGDDGICFSGLEATRLELAGWTVHALLSLSSCLVLLNDLDGKGLRAQ